MQGIRWIQKIYDVNIIEKYLVAIQENSAFLTFFLFLSLK